jgi:hypothetical protein
VPPCLPDDEALSDMLGVLLRRLAAPIENQTGAAIEPNPHW